MKLADRLDFFKGLSIIYAVGIAGHAFDITRPLMFFLTPAVLVISGVIIILAPLRRKDTRVIAWILSAALLTFFIEVIGVGTGKIFGAYSYGTVLGRHILGVPPVIGFNWVIVVYGGLHLAEHLTYSPLLRALAAASMVVIFDVILEPVAISFGYWRWAGRSVPLQNYAAWFVIALFFALVYVFMVKEERAKLPAFYFLLLCVYFLILNILTAVF